MNNNQNRIVIDEGLASLGSGENSQTYINFEGLACGEDLDYYCDKIRLDIDKYSREFTNQACCCMVYGFYAEPILLAAASTVLEGIIQGASYDLAKIYVRGGLDNLRTKNLQRSRADGRHQSVRKTEILFGWESSNINGQKRRNIHFSFKREYKWMSNHKRLGSLKASQPRSQKRSKMN